MINRSIQSLFKDTYGRQAWDGIAREANLGFNGFEALMTYDDCLTERVITAACEKLHKPRDVILEDLGTYLASHQNLEPVRRLLRFGGDTFIEFLRSLDDLQGRAMLAVPELELPRLDLREHSLGNFTLSSTFDFAGHGHVMVGILRTMADDYGTLAMSEHLGRNGCVETISVKLLDSSFAQGRAFKLSAGIG